MMNLYFIVQRSPGKTATYTSKYINVTQIYKRNDVSTWYVVTSAPGTSCRTSTWYVQQFEADVVASLDAEHEGDVAEQHAVRKAV